MRLPGTLPDNDRRAFTDARVSPPSARSVEIASVARRFEQPFEETHERPTLGPRRLALHLGVFQRPRDEHIAAHVGGRIVREPERLGRWDDGVALAMQHEERNAQ